MTAAERLEAIAAAERAERAAKLGGEPQGAAAKLEAAAAKPGPQAPGANETAGDQMANTIAFGALDKVRPAVGAGVQGVNEWVSRLLGREAPPPVPQVTGADVQRDLKLGEEAHPTAAALGKAGGRGIQALAAAPLLPFTGGFTSGAAATGIPAGIQNAVEYGRGKKTGGEAVADTAIEAGLAGAGGKFSEGLSRLLQPTAQIASMPAEKIAETAARPLQVPLKAAVNEITDPNRALRSFGVGGLGMLGAGGAHGVTAIAGPPVVAGAAAMGKNVGTLTARDAMSMLSENPALAVQLAKNPTAFQRVVQALFGAGGAVGADAAIPN